MKKLTISQKNWTVKSYESYLAPLTSFMFKDMLVFGYKTETNFCHKTGLIISNKIFFFNSFLGFSDRAMAITMIIMMINSIIKILNCSTIHLRQS